jgi:cytochrome c-type biogenesis protein CcmH/NrfG
MTQEATIHPPAAPPLRSQHVYALAAICLAAGLAIGYVASAPLAAGPPTAVTADTANLHPSGPQPVSLSEMKQAADRQAAPLLRALSTRPGDAAVLAQLGAIYHMAHQYQRAAGFYREAVRADPANLALRSKLAASLYRNGDVDGAIDQLNQALRSDPNDANALFNLGTIRLESKGDVAGALASWRRLLQANPQLSADRKSMVEQLIAHLQQTQRSVLKGAPQHDER